MRIKVSPAGIKVAFRRYSANLAPVMRAAEKESAGEALQIARKLSSGPYKSRTLRRMGHPYARRRPRPPMHPGIINAQSERFKNAWKVRAPRKTASGMVTRLVNDAPYARYLLEGTKRMIPRPIDTLIHGEMRKVRDRIIKRHLRRWLAGQ